MRTITGLLCIGFATQTSGAQLRKNSEQKIQGLGQKLTQSLTDSQKKQEHLGQILSDQLRKGVQNLAETAGEGATIQVPNFITHKILYTDETADVLPGVYHLSKGFNAFKGVPLFEGGQSSKDVFTFTFDEGKGTSGSNGYLVPDQMDIPPLSYQCQYSDRASEVTIGSSTEFMEAYESSVSHEASASAGGGYGGFSASVEASYKNANSSARESSRSARSEGKERQMSTSAIATLYTFALKEGEEQTFLSKDFEDDIKKLKGWDSYVKFIATYGTHYLKKANMGARFQENIYFKSEATSEDIASARKEANSNSISGSVSGGYGGFSASGSYGREGESSSSDSSGSSESSEETFERGGMRQFGQIAASGKCGELLGEENILFPVEYETEPLYKLINKSKYPDQRSSMKVLVDHMIKQGLACAKEWCSNEGTCVVDQFFFEKPYQGFDLQKIFKKGECVCNQDRMGHDCGQELDLAQVKEQTQKNAKKLVWTTMMYSDKSIKNFMVTGHMGQTRWMQFLTNDPEYAVFSSGAYHQEWRDAVARFGYRCIAVNKKQALAANVIAKPDTYKTTSSGALSIIEPVCPQGFSAVQEQLYWGWNAGVEQKTRFREGTVQCVNDKYMLSAGEARQKYGFVKEAAKLIQYMSSTRMSNIMFLSTPDTYKYKDEYSSFDLGLTGRVYYPAFCITVRKAEKFIDFGHQDFFFTEEPRKTMDDMINK